MVPERLDGVSREALSEVFPPFLFGGGGVGGGISGFAVDGEFVVVVRDLDGVGVYQFDGNFDRLAREAFFGDGAREEEWVLWWKNQSSSNSVLASLMETFFVGMDWVALLPPSRNSR